MGKLNHFPEIEAKINWPKFRRDVATVMQKCGKAQYSDETRKGYKFKHQLIKRYEALNKKEGWLSRYWKEGLTRIVSTFAKHI